MANVITINMSRYGWIPDLPDHRDRSYSAPVEIARELPSDVDLRAQCPPVYDQGQLGSCTANAIAAAIEFDQIKQKQAPVFTPSRLFIYYNERVIEHSVASDSGAQIRDGIKSVSKQGDCPETEWLYVVAKFKTKPPKSCYADALKYKAASYERLTPVLSPLKGCLASGYPFVFGFTVYESFESAHVAKTGHAALPKSDEQVVGGHAVMCVGYNDSKQWFVVRNSWGSSWGMKGYFTLPYAYLLSANLASDFWTIRIVA
jgi:C1A family cysteine protease